MNWIFRRIIQLNVANGKLVKNLFQITLLSTDSFFSYLPSQIMAPIKQPAQEWALNS